MITTHDIIRDRLMIPIGYMNIPTKGVDYDQAIKDTILLMEVPSIKAAQRLVLAANRYGKINKNRKEKYDYVAFIQRRLDKYKETGNKDWLIDVRNGCDLEYFFESHPDSHYNPVDEHDIHEEQI